LRRKKSGKRMTKRSQKQRFDTNINTNLGESVIRHETFIELNFRKPFLREYQKLSTIESFFRLVIGFKKPLCSCETSRLRTCSKTTSTLYRKLQTFPRPSPLPCLSQHDGHLKLALSHLLSLGRKTRNFHLLYPLYYLVDANYEILDKIEEPPIPTQTMDLDEGLEGPAPKGR
jgi:hypothetical protein